MPITVLTVATDPSRAFRLQESCGHYGFRLVVLGQSAPWSGFCLKYRLIRDFLESDTGSDDNMLVLFSDAYDTICQGTPEDTIMRFQRLSGSERKFVVSAELYLWPPIFAAEHGVRAHFEEHAPPPIGVGHATPQSIFPCSGGWIANKKTALKTLNRILTSVKGDNEDDQAALIVDLVSHPSEYHLDYDCEIFQTNLYHLQEHNEIKRIMNETLNPILAVNKDFKLMNLRSRTIPIFLHSNGAGGEALDRLQRDYITPLLRLSERQSAPVLPPIYVITLPARRDLILEFAKTHRFEIIIWPATTHSDLPTPIGAGLSRTEFLCKLSHMSVIKHCLRSKEAIIIFEDDVGAGSEICGEAPIDVIARQLKAFLSVTMYDILLLGRCFDTCNKSVISSLGKEYVEPEHVSCSHAYVIAPWAIQKIYALLEGQNPHPIDHAFNACREHGIRFLSSNPPVLKQIGLMTTLVDSPHGNAKMQSRTCSENIHQEVIEFQAIISTAPTVNTIPSRALLFCFLGILIFILILCFFLKYPRTPPLAYIG
jgi:hypothetical protein